MLQRIKNFISHPECVGMFKQKVDAPSFGLAAKSLIINFVPLLY